MEDLLGWANPTEGADLVAHAAPIEVPRQEPYARKKRSRPNRGRKKRTNRNPPLVEPPWDMLRELGIPLPPTLACLPYTPTNWRRGPAYSAWRKAVIERWGTTCHLCGHGQAYTADHLIPVSVWNNQPYDSALARPAHGVEGCPTCHIPCNSSRGNKALARAIGQYRPPVQL